MYEGIVMLFFLQQTYTLIFILYREKLYLQPAFISPGGEIGKRCGLRSR